VRHARTGKNFLALTTALLLVPTSVLAGYYVVATDADSYLKEAAPAETHGAEVELPSKSKTGDNLRPVFRFDLSSIPAGETVLSAIAVFNVTLSNNEPVEIYRITNSWTESSANWNNLAGSYDPGTRYGAFVPRTVGPVAVDLTAVVREWRDSVHPNHGVMFVSAANDKESGYSSKEWATSPERPVLYVRTSELPSMRMATGSYLGDGFRPRPFTGLGFQPDMVLIKANNNTATVARTSTMYGDAAKELGPGSALLVDNILSLDKDGFTIGSDSRVNQLGIQFFWVAIRAAPGEMVVGSYLGDGVDDRNITGIGFQPDHLIVMAESSEKAMQRYAAHVGDASREFEKSDPKTDRIQAFLADGFQVGGHNSVNDAKVMYHYVAWNTTPGYIESGTYDGNDAAFRNILGVGFQPEYVFLTADRNSFESVHRMASLPGDATFRVNTGTVLPELIRSLLPDGFQVGPSPGANSSGESYFWTAFRDHRIVDADLEISIAVDDSLPNENDTIHFVLTLDNAGPTDATGIEVTDLLPPGLTYVTHIATQGPYDDVTGVWSVGDLADGSAAGLSITATVDTGTAGTTLVNKASVTAVDQPDPDPSDNSQSVNVHVRGADIEVGKTVDDAAPNEGGAVTYRVRLTNTGPDDASGVEVMDLLPEGVTYVSDDPTRGTYSEATGRWIVGVLAVGDTAWLSIDATVDPGTGGSTITNTAAVVAVDQTEIDSKDNSARADITVQSADLAVRKTVDDSTPAESDPIAFTVKVLNAGPNDATGVEINDLLPSGVTYSGYTASQGSYDDATGAWMVGSVSVADTATLVIDAMVDPGTAGWTINNLATVAGADQADPIILDNSAFAKITVQSNVFRMGTGHYLGDGELTRSVTDVGFRPDVVILQGTDGRPLTVKSSSMPSTASKELGWPYPMRNNIITSLDANGFTFGPDGRMNQTGADYYWVAFKTAPGNMVVGSYSGDGNDNRSITGLGFSPSYLMVLPEWYPEATQRFPTHAGDQSVAFGYSDQSTNWIQAFLPDGFEVGTDSLVNASGLMYHYVAWRETPGVSTGGLHTGNGFDNQNITGLGFQPEWVLLKRETSADGTVHRPAALAGDQTFSARNGWTYTNGIQALLPDGFQIGNDNSVNQLSVGYHWMAFRDPSVPEADVEVAVAVSDTAPIEGDTLTYTVTLRNNGPDAAGGVQLIDLLPAGVTYVFDSPEQGTYSPVTGLWDAGVVLSGDSASLDIGVVVDPGTLDSTIVNAATIASSNQSDPDTANNTAIVSITVGPSEFRVVSGSYVGDGSANQSITGVGFRPDVVLIKGNLDVSPVMRTATMRGDVSKPIGSKTGFLPNLIGSLDADGFTVGGSNRVNQAGASYYWTAFQAARPELVVGVYEGDGVDDRSISVGFRPEYMIVMNEASEDAVQRFGPQVGDASLLFSDGDPLTDRIQAFEPGGFQVGRDPSTNANGDTIHYVAWKAVPDRAESRSYPGDGGDDRDLVGHSFNPNFLLVQRNESGSYGVFRTIANSGDNSLPVAATPVFGDRIQKFLSHGFQIGTSPEVNDSASTYYWIAFKDNQFLDIAVSMSANVTAANVGDVVTFTVTVVNNGPADATGVELRDVLPPGLLYDSDTPSQGSYTTGEGVWNVGDLPVGMSADLELRAKVDSGTAGWEIVNTAALLKVDQTDIDAGNDWASSSLRVKGADLSVAITADDSVYSVGDTVIYTIALSNGGPDDATGVAVADSLPPGLTYLAESSSHGVYDTTSGVWALGPLASGEADTLLITARIDAGTFGWYITDTVYIAGSEVADTDGSNNADSVTVLVPTPVELADVPGSLFPSSAFVGAPALALRIGVDNAWAVGVTLDTRSHVRFTDGIHIFEGVLANQTYVPPIANDFTLAFGPGVVPDEMTADTTYHLTLSLTGTTDEGLPYAQSVSTAGTNSIFIDSPKVVIDAVLIGDAVASPGDTNVSLLTLEFENQYADDRTLDTLVVENAASGLGDQTQLDRLTATLRLFADVDSSRTLTTPDSLLSTSAFAGGQATFAPASGWFLAASSSGALIVAADVDSTSARDGDVVDAVVSREGDIGFAEPVVFAAEISPLYPLDSYGATTIDGMMSHQVEVFPSAMDTLYSGATDALVLGIVIPPNAYEPDTLRAIDIQDFSGGFDPNDFERVKLYRDDGDGTFEAASDIRLGDLVYSGDRYEITGLSTPAGPAQTYFVAVDVAVTPTSGNTFRPGIPVNGITVTTGNDGPLDTAVISDTTYTTVCVEKIDVSSLPLTAIAVHAGDVDLPLLEVEVRNNTTQTVTLDSLRLVNATSGPGTQARLDGELASVDVYLDDGNGVVDVWDVSLAANHTFSSGSLTTGYLGQSLEPGEFAALLVAVDVDSFCVRDLDSLRVRLGSAADLYFHSPLRIDGSFPFEPDAPRPIDGMLSFQIGVFPSSDSLLISKTTDILVMDLTIPANGYMVDTLTALQVENLGSATDEHIETVNLWADGGNGTFDGGAGDDVWMTSLVSLGYRQYQRTGLAHPLTETCAGGTRFFLSCDLTTDYTSSATVQFGVPVKGVQVASTNDGPIDASVIDPSTGLVPRPDELTVFPYSVGDKRVYPGSSNNLNFGIGLYNGFMTPRTLDGITLFRDGLLSADEIVRMTAFADADTNGLFNPLMDRPIAVVSPSDNGFDEFSGLGLELTPQKITYLFVAYDLQLSGVRDSVDIDLQIRQKNHLVLTPYVDPENIEPDFKDPLNSPGIDITDGMIAAQIRIHAAPSDRAAPGDQHVLAMGMTIPANGTLPDRLNYLTILNAGDAVAGQDIDRFDLWLEDGGAPNGFEPLEDRLLSTLVWTGSAWKNTADVTTMIPRDGLKCYVTFSASTSADDDRTVQAIIPIGGIEVLSGNDGPVDTVVSNPNLQTISTDPLITTMSTDRPAYSTGQQIVVSMRVRNEGSDSLRAVTAPAPALAGDGSAVYVDGPSPVAVDLPPGNDTTLVWHYEASAVGEVQFCGFAHDGDSTEISIQTCTPAVVVQERAVEVTMALAGTVPVSVNRGQKNVEAIAMQITYSNYSSHSAPALFDGIEISIDDGSGAPIAPNSVLDEITIVSSTGSNQPFALVDSVSNPLRLRLNEAIRIEPGDSLTLDTVLDIATDAVLSPFRLSIDSAAAIAVIDANDGTPVPLTTGAVFPWATNVVDVEVPAESLLVSAASADAFFANYGQEQVEVFQFSLLNNGLSGSANEILKTLVLDFHDSTGASIAPAGVIRNLTLRSGESQLYFTEVLQSASSNVTCDLDVGLLLPPQTSRDVSVTAGLKAFPLQEGFYISLAAPASVSARDNNDGGFVAVAAAEPATFPIASSTVLFQHPASGLSTSYASLVPPGILPGSSGVPLVEIAYSHADSVAASIVVDSLAVEFLDHSGNALFPGDYFSQLTVVNSGDTLAALTSLSSVSNTVQAHLVPSVSLAPLETDSFRLYLTSKAVYTPTEFRVRVDREHVVAYDANTGERILAIDGDFPFFSDYSSLQLAGDAVSSGLLDRLPPNVTGRESGIPVFDFVVRNDNPSGYTPSVLRGLTVRMHNWKGAVLNPTRYLSGGTLALGDSVVSTATIDAGSIAFALFDGVVLTEPGTADSLVFLADLAASGDETFRFVIADTSGIDIRDAVTGGPIASRTIGDAGYPLATALTHVLGATGQTAFSNYPNPFAAGREATRITFYLDRTSRVTLKVYTLWGALVETLVDNETRSAGLHQDVEWFGRNGAGDVVNNGVYYLVLETEPTGSGSSTSLKRKVGVVR
jgi:uncharacterized repeat protein (TIGR01451 family)